MAAKKGVFISIVSDKTGCLPYADEIEGITLTRIDRSKLMGFLERRALKRVISENNADIIVWCGAPSSAIHLNHQLSQLETIGKPIVWEIDMDIQNIMDLKHLSFRELLRPGHSLLLPKLLAMACSKPIIRCVGNSASVSRIVVPSQSLKNSLCRLGIDSNKISVILSTIEEKETRFLGAGEKNLFRSRLGFKQSDFIITYFGSPCTMRGTDTAVLSMKRILASKRNTKLVLLSRRDPNDSSVEDNTSNNPGGQHSRDEEEYLRKLISKVGIENNVQIISGIMNRSDLINYLIVSDVIVLPFKYVFSEPPLSVLEAMSLGKAVITTKLSTLSEIMGNDRGILIEPNSPRALAQAVLNLMDHPEQSASIGKNAQRFVASLDNWDQVTQHFEVLLKRTLNGGS